MHKFTVSSEAEAPIYTLDNTMLQYLAMLYETLKSLRFVFGVDPAKHASKIWNENEEEIILLNKWQISPSFQQFVPDSLQQLRTVKIGGKGSMRWQFERPYSLEEVVKWLD